MIEYRIKNRDVAISLKMQYRDIFEKDTHEFLGKLRNVYRDKVYVYTSDLDAFYNDSTKVREFDRDKCVIQIGKDRYLSI